MRENGTPKLRVESVFNSDNSRDIRVPVGFILFVAKLRDLKNLSHNSISFHTFPYREKFQPK